MKETKNRHASWITSPPGSPWILTPMSPPLHRRKPPRPREMCCVHTTTHSKSHPHHGISMVGVTAVEESIREDFLLSLNGTGRQTVDDVLDQAEVQDNDRNSNEHRACREASEVCFRQIEQANSYSPHIPIF